MDKAGFGVNDFLNAEQRIRLACVCKYRGNGLDDDRFFLSAREILYVLDGENESTSVQSFAHWINNLVINKVGRCIRGLGYDSGDFN